MSMTMCALSVKVDSLCSECMASSNKKEVMHTLCFDCQRLKPLLTVLYKISWCIVVKVDNSTLLQAFFHYLSKLELALNVKHS
jgi:hypothetical protein